MIAAVTSSAIAACTPGSWATGATVSTHRSVWDTIVPAQTDSTEMGARRQAITSAPETNARDVPRGSDRAAWAVFESGHARAEVSVLARVTGPAEEERCAEVARALAGGA